MAYLSSKVFPVSAVIDNVSVTSNNNKSRLDVITEVNTLNCVISTTGMPGAPCLSAYFTDSGTIMYINGVSYNPRTTYLQIRKYSGSNIVDALFEKSLLVFSRILHPNENFDISIPYGITGFPFYITICDSPITNTLSKNLAFFTVNYKKY